MKNKDLHAQKRTYTHVPLHALTRYLHAAYTHTKRSRKHNRHMKHCDVCTMSDVEGCRLGSLVWTWPVQSHKLGRQMFLPSGTLGLAQTSAIHNGELSVSFPSHGASRSGNSFVVRFKWWLLWRLTGSHHELDAHSKTWIHCQAREGFGCEIANCGSDKAVCAT